MTYPDGSMTQAEHEIIARLSLDEAQARANEPALVGIGHALLALYELLDARMGSADR